MAVAVAASPAVPVSALLFAQALVLASGLALREPATPERAPSARTCSDCTTDSIHTVIVARARNAARDGAWNEAAELWRDALLIDDRRGAHWLAMGDVLVSAERYREAAAAYERAIQVDARLTQRATRGVARAYARAGDDRQAVRWLEQSIAMGVRPEELLRDETFRRYRDEPRLRGALRRQVDRRGAAVARGVGAST
jgi:tetratricopeptide (TPR) repeat protein